MYRLWILILNTVHEASLTLGFAVWFIFTIVVRCEDKIDHLQCGLSCVVWIIGTSNTTIPRGLWKCECFALFAPE